MQRGLLITFGALMGLVVLGLAVLPGPTANAWMGQTLPQPLAGIWLSWLFALWGALVCLMLFVGAWVAQGLAASERAAPLTLAMQSELERRQAA